MLSAVRDTEQFSNRPDVLIDIFKIFRFGWSNEWQFRRLKSCDHFLVPRYGNVEASTKSGLSAATASISIFKSGPSRGNFETISSG